MIAFAKKSGSGNAENKNNGLMPKMWLLVPAVVRIKQPTYGKSICLSRNLWRQLVSDVTLVLPTEKYRCPCHVYVARDPGCCEVVSGASCPSRGKCSSGPSIHQKPAIWRLWVDISLLHLGMRQLLFPLGCCVCLGLWWQCVVNFEAEGQSSLKPLLKSLKSHRIATNTSRYLESYEWKGAIQSGKVEPGDSHQETLTNHLHCDNGCVRKWSGFAQSTLWNVVNSHDSTPLPHRTLPEKSAKKGSKSLKTPTV